MAKGCKSFFSIDAFHKRIISADIPNNFHVDISYQGRII